MDAQQLTTHLPHRLAAPAVLAAGRFVGLAIAAAGDATIARGAGGDIEQRGARAAMEFGVTGHDSVRFSDGLVMIR